MENDFPKRLGHPELGPKRAKSGIGILGGGSEPPSHQLVGLRSTLSFPSGVQDGAWEKFGFLIILAPQKARLNCQICFLSYSAALLQFSL